MMQQGESIQDLAARIGKLADDLKEVNRGLTQREVRVGHINKYAPCGCGSGKKFKFCCFKK
jgi:uncharacterized protein YecA (UPF0149 family)